MSERQLTDHALQENLPSWGVLVLESHHSKQFTMDWRVHDFLKLVYVLRGRGVLEFRDRVNPFEANDLIVVPPETENRITDAPDAASSLYVCCLATELFAFQPDLIDGLRRGLLPTSSHLSHRFATQLRRMRHQQAGDQRMRAISTISSAMKLVEWIMQVEDVDHRVGDPRQQFASDREVMEDYVKRLSTEFYEATTIDAAADSIGMSRRVFTRLFQETTGATWLNHVRKLAINHAKHQLAQTNLAITSVAFECGFNDLSTFYRQFKSQVGLSPKAYRRSVGGSP